MQIYLVDDDINIINILKIIIKNRDLGEICGIASNGEDALDDFKELKPDIIIVDLLMPIMDGITFVKKAKSLSSYSAFIMLSQVSSKDMIASAYESGIEYFLQKPINSIEVENVISKVTKNLTLQRTIEKMQNLFEVELKPTVNISKNKTSHNNSYIKNLHSILQRLGIIGDLGSKDIIEVVSYLIDNNETIHDSSLSTMLSQLSDSPKSLEQRIRRAATAGLVNLANLGIEDYGNDIFIDYSNTLYNFEQVKREMDYIRGKSTTHGKVQIKNFLNSLVFYSQKK